MKERKTTPVACILHPAKSDLLPSFSKIEVES
jgi:hypothetical protein